MNGTSLEMAAEWVRQAGNVVALTGAGISTESGIPDFRGPQGVWTKNPGAEKLSDIYYYMNDRDVRVSAWKARIGSPLWDAKPNDAHVALVDLERKNRLSTLVTQNIDGLHQAAGTSHEILVEIHGNSREVVCMSCGQRAPTERALARVRAGEDDPPCKTCGGILKTATISFGQSLVTEDLDRSFEAAAKADVMLAIGTSLIVYPIAHMADIAIDGGAKLLIFNSEPTPYDRLAEATFTEMLGSILPRLVELV